MIPKTEVIFSLSYNKHFDKSFNEENLKKLKSNSKKFIEIYKKNINKILKLISKFSRFPWRDNRIIPIFINKNTSSFTCGSMISLRWKKDNKIMIMRLIHELIHVNLSFFVPYKPKDSEFHEGATTFISRYVINKIFPGIKEDKFIEKKYEKFTDKIKYNLNKHPFKYYLNKNKK